MPASLTVRVRPGPPLSAVLADPSLRSVAARLGEAMLRRWPQVSGCTVLVTHSRTTLFSLRERDQELQFSVHFAVLPQEQDLLRAILFKDEAAWKRLHTAFSGWRDQAADQGTLPPRRVESLDPRGQVYDLAALFAEQNATHFKGSLDSPIGWGRFSPEVPGQRHIRLGSCGGQPPRIRLHPVLDHTEVPLRFVRFVVFHEMLHLAIPPHAGAGGRRSVHPRAFRARERAHPDFAFSNAWEKANIDRLLQRAAG